MSRSPGPLRWGVAAAGSISFDFLNAMTTVDDHQRKHRVVAVAARSRERAAELAAKFNVGKACGGYEELAGDEEIEVVYVATIHPHHLEVCRAMIDAGKSVLCEKPLAMNARETRELVDLAREKKVFLMEAMWTRCLPAHAAMKEALRSDAVGRVTHVDVNFGQMIDRERLFKKELGGGSILDLGVYCVFFALDAFDGERPESVVTAGHLNDEGTDTFATSVWLYPGGRSAALTVHSRCVTSCEANIYGEKGSVKMLEPFHGCNVVEVNGRRREWPLREGRHPFLFGNVASGLAFEAEHVRECLEKGLTESPLVGLDQTILAAELLEQMRKQVGVRYGQDID